MNHRSRALLAVAVATAAGAASASSAAATSADQPRADIENGTLVVRGTDAGETLTLRLVDKRDDRVQVDFGADGLGDRQFKRSDFTALRVELGGGADAFSVDETAGTFTDTVATTVDGGSGDDVLLGGVGAESLIGGEGDDFVDGNRGSDVARLGGDDDTFRWDPGDGSDTVEGQGGADSMLFNGAGAAENFDVSANGSRVRFFRNAGNIVMDLDDVETIDLEALGGVDNVVVNDLSGTDLAAVNSDLEGGTGTGDGAADTVTVNGSDRDDTFDVTAEPGRARVTGAVPAIEVRNADGALDRLVVNGLGGSDVAATAIAPGSIVFQFND